MKEKKRWSVAIAVSSNRAYYQQFEQSVRNLDMNENDERRTLVSSDYLDRSVS